MSGRGELTDEIHARACELLDENDFTQQELRLMPYIQYTLMNVPVLDARKLNAAEQDILLAWAAKGWVTLPGEGRVQVSKEFWDAMHELLWLAYVNYD